MNFIEKYLNEEELSEDIRREEEIISEYLNSIPTLGRINPKTGRVEYTDEELEKMFK